MEWDGENGANAQISGIKGYNWAEGHCGTNSYEDAVEFLKTHTIRKTPVNFDVGTEMTFEEMAVENPLPPNPKVSVAAPDTVQPDTKEEILPPPGLDRSRISKAAICDKVNCYCEEYDYSQMSVDQRRAIQAVNGKFLLFAVPGSGKTTVLLARVGYMVHACGIPANRIMSMTFTKAAAKEMRERYAKRFPDDRGEAMPDFRTIHSFCMRDIIPKLRRAGYKCPNHVIDEDLKDRSEKGSDKKKYSHWKILAEVLKKSCIGKNASDESTQEAFQAAFSSIKNRQMKPDDYANYFVIVDKKEIPIAPVYQLYQNKLEELDCMDYDDMLIHSLKGLNDHREVLAFIQSRYAYWSIDEAQDNSKVQHDLMVLLAGPNGNLFMVGDDDQSIYSFRGAEPHMLLKFGNMPDVTPMVMGTNYRSDSDIVLAAKAFIEHNCDRADKEMRASHTEHGLIRIPESFRTEVGQYAYIVDTAKRYKARGRTLGVLYQLNASAFPLIVYMHRAGVPFESSKGLKDLMDGGTAGNLLKTLRFAHDPTDMDLFEKLYRLFDLNYLDGKERMKKLRSLHKDREKKSILSLIPEVMTDPDAEKKDEKQEERAKSLELLASILDKAAKLTPSEAVKLLVTELRGIFGIEKFTEKLGLYGLLTICDLYATIPEMLNDLDAMARKERLRNKDSQNEDTTEEADDAIETSDEVLVSLSTIHSAKGRQWDHVMLIDSFDEVFPGKPQRNRIGYDPEEASRVFYVAITRAISCLEILTVNTYHGAEISVSSFINDFAFEADMITDTPVENCSADVSSDTVSTECVPKPSVYYGVRVGREPGVYTNYDDVREQTDNYAGSQQKKFDFYAEAWEFAFPGKPVPPPKKELSCECIRRHIQRSEGAAFNYALDLPEDVQKGLLSHLGVSTVRELEGSKAENMLAENKNMFASEGRTDYHGHTDYYAAAYLPAYFYKIWLPLWKLIKENDLPRKAKILELGPGPGTSTWSVVSLYKQLARENPDEQFALDYTAVEWEADFKRVFTSIGSAVQADLPANLSVDIMLLTPEDAFGYIETENAQNYDLILESNMLNRQETFNARVINGYLKGLDTALKDSGFAILVEPREYNRPTEFFKLAEYAQKEYGFTCYSGPANSAVNMSGIKLVQDSIRIGLRYSGKTVHAFCYTILQKKGTQTA